MSAEQADQSGRLLTVDADDLDAVINLVERSIQMLRELWNDMPVNETDAFVRLREVADRG